MDEVKGGKMREQGRGRERGKDQRGGKREWRRGMEGIWKRTE